MSDFFVSHEPAIRLACFTVLFCFFASLEVLKPRRAKSQSTAFRWSNNAALFFVGILLIRALVPLLPAAAAIWAQDRSLGLFNHVNISLFAQCVMTFLALDCLVYWQHRLFHRIPLLWRIHRVHHADGNLDVTSALRFHPVEIVISLAFKLAAVVLIGAPALAVIVFEIVLNGGALFSHANFALPSALDKTLRRVVVTPDFHRLHHSQSPKESNRNFGFFISWWDYLFCSYQAQPGLGHVDMKIGLAEYSSLQQATRVDKMLAMPFIDTPAAAREKESR